MGTKIFISYATEDYETAKRLYDDLKKHQDIEPWLDREDLLPGENSELVIRQTIKKSNYFLLLISKYSITNRGDIQKQQRIALDISTEVPPGQIFIIPARLEDCQPRYDDLTVLRSVDLFPSDAYEDGLKKILCVLKPGYQTNDKINRGILAPKMCNRVEHEAIFEKFFEEKFEKCPKQPHFYFIEGDEHSGHESFIERLLNTCIKKHVEKKYGKEYTAIKKISIEWPGDSDDLESKKIIIERQLREHVFQKIPLVSIIQNIHSKKWNRQNERFLEWYIREYWSTHKCNDNNSQFLIFFNIRYEKKSKSIWKRIFGNDNKEYIKEKLESILKSLVEDKYLCHKIKELNAITKEDVIDWFSKIGIEYDKWFKEVDSIFENEEQKDMLDIQPELEKIIDKCKKEGFAEIC